MARGAAVLTLAVALVVVVLAGCTAVEHQSAWCAYHGWRLAHDLRHHHHGWAVLQALLAAHHCTSALSGLLGG